MYISILCSVHQPKHDIAGRLFWCPIGSHPKDTQDCIAVVFKKRWHSWPSSSFE